MSAFRLARAAGVLDLGRQPAQQAALAAGEQVEDARRRWRSRCARGPSPPRRKTPSGRFWIGKSVAASFADSTKLRERRVVGAVELRRSSRAPPSAAQVGDRLGEGARAEGRREVAARGRDRLGGARAGCAPREAVVVEANAARRCSRSTASTLRGRRAGSREARPPRTRSGSRASPRAGCPPRR